MSILNAKDDAAALKPLEDAALTTLDQVTIPALGAALKQALEGAADGLTVSISPITITVTKKADGITGALPK